MADAEKAVPEDSRVPLRSGDEPAGYGAPSDEATPIDRPRAGALQAFVETIESARQRGIFKDEEVGDQFQDAMTYDANGLTSLSLLTRTAGTVWTRPKLWSMVGQLFLLSTCIALLVLAIVDDPTSLQISKFAKISTFLSVFVGLLLGFFMSSSMARWYSCASGFLQLFDAIRNLQVQFYALGVEQDKMDDCLRYALISAWLLSLQLRVEVQPPADKPAAKEKMWSALREHQETPRGAHKVKRIFKGLTEADEAQLQKTHDPSLVIWVWISNMIARMAQDGDIPPMPSPTYGRIMSLAESGHGGIREVRASVSVQAPFIYVQVLAALVHLNNLFNAISFGMTWGASIGTTLSAFNRDGYEHHARMKDIARDSQNVVVSFFLSIFGPFVYVALLEVAIAIAQPFCSKDGEIPTRRMLIKLEADLNDAQALNETMPSKWQRPCFKNPPPAKK